MSSSPAQKSLETIMEAWKEVVGTDIVEGYREIKLEAVRNGLVYPKNGSTKKLGYPSTAVAGIHRSKDESGLTAVVICPNRLPIRTFLISPSMANYCEFRPVTHPVVSEELELLKLVVFFLIRIGRLKK